MICETAYNGTTEQNTSSQLGITKLSLFFEKDVRTFWNWCVIILKQMCHFWLVCRVRMRVQFQNIIKSIALLAKSFCLSDSRFESDQSLSKKEFVEGAQLRSFRTLENVFVSE